jgi:hypothetical protein
MNKHLRAGGRYKADGMARIKYIVDNTVRGRNEQPRIGDYRRAVAEYFFGKRRVADLLNGNNTAL